MEHKIVIGAVSWVHQQLQAIVSKRGASGRTRALPVGSNVLREGYKSERDRATEGPVTPTNDELNSKEEASEKRRGEKKKGEAKASVERLACG